MRTHTLWSTYMLAFILASDFGQILLHKTIIYLCSALLTVYTVIQIYIALVRQTQVSVILYKALNFDWFSKKTQLWNRVICFRVICFWFH